MPGNQLAAGQPGYSDYVTSSQYYINSLINNNPNIKADPYLAQSLTQMFKNSANPQVLAHSTWLTSLLHKSADQIGLSNLYPPFQGETIQQDRQNIQVPNKWWEATNSTAQMVGNWFKPVGNVLGSAMGGIFGFLGGKDVGQQVGNFWRAAPSSVASWLTGAIGKAEVATGQAVMGKYSVPEWKWQDPLYLGEFLKEALHAGGRTPIMADAFMSNLKSQINQQGIGTALGQQYGNLLGGMALGGVFGAAEGATAFEASSGLAATADAADAQVIKSLTEKLTQEGSLTPEEQAALEKAKQDLVSRDKNALHKMNYQQGLDEYSSKFPTSLPMLQKQLETGAITQAEFDSAIAKDLAEGSQGAFTKASEAINGDAATARAAQDATQAATLSTSDKVWQNVARALTYPVALPIKGLAGLIKTLGTPSANITYILSALQAQNNPRDAYIWRLAEQGKVLNADGTTDDLGVEVAHLLGIDGMWGTAVRDLTDVGLKWIVDDPIASYFRVVQRARSFYGMTGALGKWFGGTGIREVGDVERAYIQYSSVRRAINWIANHGAADIAKRFNALFLGTKLINRLAEAKTSAQVIAILEEASQAINIANRITRMPVMGWYTFAKTGLTGKAGEEFATLADALASPNLPTKDIIDAIERETGVDITPHDVGYAAGGVAQKAEVLLATRLRRLFNYRQMINEGGRITDRKLVVGSARSVVGIMQFLANSYLSKDFVNMVGDQLLRYGDDPVKWNNIYNNALRIALYRHTLATAAHADFGLAIDKIRQDMDDRIAEQSGADGGSAASGQAMVASNNALADFTYDPETGKLTVSAIDSYQLGERMLPNLREFRQLAKFTGKTLMKVNRSEAQNFLRSTEKTFEIIRQLAETAGVKAENFIRNFKPADRADEFAFDKKLTSHEAAMPRAEGYRAKGEEITARAEEMLKGDELKGLTQAERYATVVKYLDSELAKARDAYVTATKKLQEMMAAGESEERIQRTLGAEDVHSLLYRLNGEMIAVQDLGAEMKAAITSSYDNAENIDKQGRYLAAMEDTPEEGDKFLEAFREQWKLDYNRKVGDWGRINISKIEVLGWKSLGERKLRDGFDVAVDLMQGYLNGWFKLLTLSTPAWAERVTISEVLLNALRMGGHNLTESKLAQSIAKNQLYLGKVAMGEVERKALRSAISNIILGIDKALADTLKGREFNDFLDFTTNLYLETDGHMLGGVHVQGDLMSEDGFTPGISNSIAGIDSTGNVKFSNKILGENFRRRNSNDLDAGAAYYEAITRASRGPLTTGAAEFQLNRLREEGQRIFDRHPEIHMDYARKEAMQNMKDQGKEITERVFKAELEKALDSRIRELGLSTFMGNPDRLAILRLETERHVEQLISEQSPEWRAQFRHDREISARYPELTPHQGWAKTVVDHLSGLTTDINSNDKITTIFHDVLNEIATKEFRTQRDYAEWFRDAKGKYAVPSAFPAHEYIPTLSAGHFNPLRKYSDWMHRRFLSKIVNTASRDPIFVWEAWQKFKELKPLLDAGYIDMAEAMRKAQTEGLINMSKFVHNPLDKTIWEENMRVLAPYYFAKNQAMRRALRMAGDNMAAFEKYLKINMAITDYAALAYNQSGIGSFTFPGSQIILGITNGIVNTWLATQGLPTYGGLKNMGIESSPASPDSIIITGTMPGIGGFLENFFQIPFGPIVSVPAKFVYEQMQYRVPVIAEAIKWALGPNAKNSGIWSDLFPNSILQNIYKAVYGHMDQNQVSSYLSAELYVLGNQADNIYAPIRNQVIETLTKQGVINKQNINSGAAQQLINYYAIRKMDMFLKDPRKQTEVQESANWATTALYVAKTLTSAATPLSAVISSDKKVQKQLTEIAQEKDSDGLYKYPTYTLQIAELLRRFPYELFDTVSHTSSPFATYNENVGTVAFVKANERMVKEHPYASAYLSQQTGANAAYSPAASQLFASLGLRNKETPKEFTDHMRIATGNFMFYDVMLPEFQKLYPGTYANKLSRQGYSAWQAAGKGYAQNVNAVWGQNEFGGGYKANAVSAYQDLQSLMKQPQYVAKLTASQKKYIPLLLEARANWETQYKNAPKGEQSALKIQWYNQCVTAATTPGWSDIAPLITGIFQKLPAPE
jgi:hypothetical protein